MAFGPGPNPFQIRLEDAISSGQWPGYVHCYPHKRAYRPIDAIDFRNVWPETTHSLNLYIHIPFCSQRCSFCNLFLIPVNRSASDQLFDTYLDGIERDLVFFSSLMPDAVLQSIYIGGGTPNILHEQHLTRLARLITASFPKRSLAARPCVECAPDLLTKEQIAIFGTSGISRVSLGLQSFSPAQLRDMRRRAYLDRLDDLVHSVQSGGMDVNLDLIYGLPSQNEDDVRQEIAQLIELAPNSASIYPLAVRERTRFEHLPTDHGSKYAMWEICDAALSSANYSVNTYVDYSKTERSDYQQQRLEFAGVPTLGIGAGARSYAPGFDYAQTYCVDYKLSRDLISQFIDVDASNRKYAGFKLDHSEQMRRFVALSLMGGLVENATFSNAFGKQVLDVFNYEFTALEDLELVRREHVESTMWSLTALGRKYSDVCSSIFISPEVSTRMETFHVR